MNPTAIEQARFNMVEQQIRTWEVLDDQVLRIMTATPREAFVPTRYHNLAFADVRIPLGDGEFMLNPNLEGRILQALTLNGDESVLLVGTGSGFLAACLSQMARHVLAVDRNDRLTRAAATTLTAQGRHNITCITGNAALDWPTEAPFDAIVLTGALPSRPTQWPTRLARGGRLFAVVGKPPIMEALLITRTDDATWTTESLFDTELAYLHHAEPAATFTF